MRARSSSGLTKRLRMETPRNWIVPVTCSSGVRSVRLLRRRRSVLLPAPDGPMIPKTWFGAVATALPRHALTDRQCQCLLTADSEICGLFGKAVPVCGLVFGRVHKIKPDHNLPVLVAGYDVEGVAVIPRVREVRAMIDALPRNCRGSHCPGDEQG